MGQRIPPQQGAQGQQGGGGPSSAELIQNVGKGLEQLTQALTQAQGVPDEIKQQMVAVFQGYSAVVQALQGGGGQQEQRQSGPVSEQAPRGGQPI